MQSTIQNSVLSILSSTEYGGMYLSELLASEPLIREESEGWTVDLSFTVPIAGVAESLVDALKAGLLDLNVAAVELSTVVPQAPALNVGNTVSGVKNIIAVASGKGGVGKSTTAVNLALALVKEGARVGMLDADIYGPSQPAMLGVDGQRPEVKNGNRIQPIQAHGLQVISMGNLVNENTPMVWRGPMVSGALQQLLLNTDWDDLDYLVIDMPPGTGDIPLTLSQKVPVTGSVIVTTPQDIALLDAKKGVEMFTKVSIPVFGVVENMAVHICSNCGHEEHIFGKDGGNQLASEYDVPTLGSLPLALSIREQTDAGKPPLVSEPDAQYSRIYSDVARKVAVAVAGAANESVPEIVIS